MSLLELASRRCIVVTGKGGVGKTTIAAALGRAIAQQGKRVLLAEIVTADDTPSQLHPALGGPAPGAEPQQTQPHLWVTLLTPAMGHLRFLQDTLPLRVLADAAMKSQGLRRFLSAAPGFADMGVMYRAVDLLRRQHPAGGPLFEVCVIDAPATGHALALAQIPEFLTRVIPHGPIFRAARDGLQVLTDPAVTACVVVTVPEPLPITEALELEAGLRRHHLPVAAMVVNRVPRDPFTAGERAALAGVVGGAVFGARELRRLERAQAALGDLRRQRPQGLVELPEVEGSGPETSARLSRLL